jgi:ribosomal protein S7
MTNKNCLVRSDYTNEDTNEVDIMVYREITRCFIGSLTKRGCKKRAKKIFNSVLELLRFKINEHPLIVLEEILSIVSPKMSLSTKKLGGSSYKLPHLISYKRGLSIAIHSLIKYAVVRGERILAERIVEELIDIIKGKASPLIKNITEIHKTALLNRPFLQYLKR